MRPTSDFQEKKKADYRRFDMNLTLTAYLGGGGESGLLGPKTSFTNDYNHNV